MEGNIRLYGLRPAIGIRPDAVSAIHASRGLGKAVYADAFVDEWLRKSYYESGLNAVISPLAGLDGWHLEADTGNICHISGSFFSIMGVHCRHRIDRQQLEWDQPIIEQPETGILGILAKSIDGVMHFCLQAKEEPGNIGGVQLSPTVQATYSNYSGAHGGAAPLFLEHFISPPPERTIFAKMQTEDGGRFLYKSNRNMVVEVDSDFPLELPNGFIWLTLRQIAGLLQRDNIINACARSILSSLVFTGAADQTTGQPEKSGADALPPTCFTDIWDTLQWLDDRRADNHMLTRRISLNKLLEWGLDTRGFFSHREKRFFKIVGLRVSTATREVKSWCQPIIESPAPGMIGLLLRHGPQELEILMQAKAEVGNKTTVQLGPTAQFTQGNYDGSKKLKKPFLFDEFLSPYAFGMVHESRQAEEGARFYRECHIHRILMLPTGADLPLPVDYRWVPLSHAQFLVHLGEQVNSCARSILACLL